MSIAERLRSNNPDMFNKVMELKNKSQMIGNFHGTDTIKLHPEAKAKAKELTDKYYRELPQWVNYNDAKQCAKIAVEEIIKELPNTLLDKQERFVFFENVLKEIDLL